MNTATFDDSPIPKITNPINTSNSPIVTGNTGITSQILCAYFTASLAERTAVAM